MIFQSLLLLKITSEPYPGIVDGDGHPRVEVTRPPLVGLLAYAMIMFILLRASFGKN